MKWISTARLVMALGLAWTASQAMAQMGETTQSFDQLSARLEQQDRQIQQLQAQMAGMQQGINATPTAYAPSGGTAADPAAPAAPQPAEVGSDMSVKARWYNGAGLMFESPNKDFTMHAGMWVQWDSNWYNQSLGMNTASATNAAVQGAPSGGIGQMEDGTYWRRIRPFIEGTFWETCEYRFNLALENNQYSTAGLDEFFIGVHNLPLVGTLRVGHVKNCLGLEGDMASSSRCMTFMERSSYSQAIEKDQNFVNGMWLGNTWLDDRVFGSFVVARPDNGSSGDFFGTGEYLVQTRWTGLPLYEDEGRHLLHLGIAGGWQNGTNSVGAGTTGADTITLQSRPEFRDDDPAASPGATTNANGAGGAGQYLADANANRLVSTGKITCSNEYILATELLYIRGPFSFQAEYGWNFLNNAKATVPAAGPTTNYIFNGGYLQVAYTLTGENRAYDKKFGTLSRYYFGGQGPYENAFLVRDADGNFCAGRGAWEVACRYSYLDLNAGSGAAFVNGGIMQGVSLGLNWYLNTNLTVNTEWVYNSRYDLPGNTVVGDVTAFGTRVQLSF